MLVREGVTELVDLSQVKLVTQPRRSNYMPSYYLRNELDLYDFMLTRRADEDQIMIKPSRIRPRVRIRDDDVRWRDQLIYSMTSRSKSMSI